MSGSDVPKILFVRRVRWCIFIDIIALLRNSCVSLCCSFCRLTDAQSWQFKFLRETSVISSCEIIPQKRPTGDGNDLAFTAFSRKKSPIVEKESDRNLGTKLGTQLYIGRYVVGILTQVTLPNNERTNLWQTSARKEKKSTQ